MGFRLALMQPRCVAASWELGNDINEQDAGNEAHASTTRSRRRVRKGNLDMGPAHGCGTDSRACEARRVRALVFGGIGCVGPAWMPDADRMGRLVARNSSSTIPLIPFPHKRKN
jgi:hypothetical protein